MSFKTKDIKQTIQIRLTLADRLEISMLTKQKKAHKPIPFKHRVS